jgi:hypothetical protein
MVTGMHAIEANLVALIEAGREPHLEALGGITAIASAARTLGATRMMPELLAPLLQDWKNAGSNERHTFKSALHDLLETATTDFVLIESVDILDRHRPLPDGADESCFMIFLAKIGQSGNPLSGMARGAALDGAFRWAAGNRRWQHRLLDVLLGLSTDDDPEFLRRAAKIAGVAYSHWRDRDLVGVLTKLLALDAVHAEAAFELGMARLAEAIDAGEAAEAAMAFGEARDWFSKSDISSEHRPEARLYLDCLDVLISYHRGGSHRGFSSVSERVRKHAFELNAWSGNLASPPWLGSRQTEAACWNLLASTVVGLAENLAEPSWWEPTVVVEELLSVYNAGRCILRRSRQGGIEELLRPRIRSALSTQIGQAHQLKLWLERNTNHEWAAEARTLVHQIDSLVKSSGDPKNPSEAASGGATLAALVAEAQLPQPQKKLLLAVLTNAFSLHFDNLTGAEVEVIERCRGEAQQHPDHRDNVNGARLFDAALLWTVRFIFNRLELARKDDPGGSYLFERDDGTLPHEGELQQDYFRWVSTNAAGTDLEATNVGSGRADLRIRSGPERLVVEVKREDCDCSFDALATAYAGQTTDYQNTSIRLGVLLVLDLATPNVDGTPHITSLFQMRKVQRTGEAEQRLVLIVKVPGRRKVPSDLTRVAKAARRGRKKH